MQSLIITGHWGSLEFRKGEIGPWQATLPYAACRRLASQSAPMRAGKVHLKNA